LRLQTLIRAKRIAITRCASSPRSHESLQSFKEGDPFWFSEMFAQGGRAGVILRPLNEQRRDLFGSGWEVHQRLNNQKRALSTMLMMMQVTRGK
jgi:hypothetical protein